MAAYAPIKIQHSPVTTYPGTVQTGFVGAQTVAGQRRTLPTFNDGNSYSISKSGSDANAGTIAAPKLTLGSLFSTSQSYNDTSGNGYNLAQTGTVPYLSYPCNPIPPQGNYAAGPFSDSNYLTGPAGLLTALSSLTQFCIEGYVYFNDLSDTPFIFHMPTGATNFGGRAAADGSLSFDINGTTLTSGTGLVVTGTWYYFAFTYQSVTSSGKQIWLGTTPTNAVNVASATQTFGTGTVSGLSFGKPVGTANRYLNGYLDRVVVSSVTRTSFPVAPSASNILGFYEMETRPLMQTAPLSYIVVQDSGEYNEGLYANFQYDITAGFGIYAADGFAPTFKLQKGVFPGTYGAGNASYVQLTSSTSTTCFVSKSGNDGTGARGNPALPFLTVQAAFTATTTAGDTVQIQDSGTYFENVTVPNRALTFQAATGQAPIITGVSKTNQITLTCAAASLNVAGIFFNGPPQPSLTSPIGYSAIQQNGGALSIYDCTFSLYEFGIDNASASLSFTDCYFNRLIFGPVSQAAAAMTYSNCFFNGNPNIGPYPSMRIDSSFSATYAPNSFRNCTFNCSVDTRNRPGVTQFVDCVFYGNVTANDLGDVGSYAFLNCDFYKNEEDGLFGFYDTALTTTCFVCNCVFNGTGADAYALKGQSATPFLILNCAISNVVTGVSATGSSPGFFYIRNVSTLNCTTAGVAGYSGVTATGLADSLSTAAYSGGVAPTSSISNADYLSTSAGNENLTLAANSPGAFLVTTTRGRTQDAGIQSALFDIVMPSVTLNGLTFEGSVNAEGGINSLTAITVKYCTFTGLGTYGINAPALSTISNNYFNTNGHAIKENGYSSTLSYNVGASCAGALIQHYGRTTAISNNTSYACGYGQYDSVGSTFSQAVNLIYAGSGAYDYSGENELSYSDVGTLDPARNNSLDAFSIQQDPLFVNASAGDLTLQALARDFFWNSPAIGTSSTAADMGAYVWTYGAIDTQWTTIDFATPDYYNPDQVLRRQLPVKLAEGDMENGAIYSVQATIKKEYEFTWNPQTNPMSLDQLDDLVAMFLAPTNQIQIDFGDGRGYVPAFFGRQQGFEYADMTGFYSDDEVPEPLRTLTIREA